MPNLVIVVERLERCGIVPDHAEKPGPEGLQVLKHRHGDLPVLHVGPEMPVIPENNFR